MVLRFGIRERRKWQTLVASSRSRWLRIVCVLGIVWVFYAVSTWKRQQQQQHRHAITTDDIEFEASHPPSPEHNGFLPLAEAEEFCKAHGWNPFPKRSSRRKIYDLVMINNEMDWLEIRLNTMNAHVDYFVIIESPVTFTRLPKALVLQENWQRFERFHDKIIHHMLENPPMEAKRTWDLEDFQRNAMFSQVIPRLSGEQAAMMGDVILVSDVDEIPRPAALEVLRNCDFPRRLTLRSRFHYYGFQWLHRGEEWAHPQATTYQGIGNTILPTDLRNGEGGNKLVAWWNKADLWNAGWHCSSCFSTIEDMLTKLSSFSHVGMNREPFRDRTRILDRVRKGLDLWDRKGEFYDRVDGTDIPEFLQRERERFEYLLYRDGSNAGFRDYDPQEDEGVER